MANGIIGNTLTTPIAMPKKVSQLENDVGYATKEELAVVENKADLVYAVSETANRAENIATQARDDALYAVSEISQVESKLNEDISNLSANVDAKIGDIETALDNIIAIQNSLIGGGSE